MSQFFVAGPGKNGFHVSCGQLESEGGPWSTPRPIELLDYGATSSSSSFVPHMGGILSKEDPKKCSWRGEGES